MFVYPEPEFRACPECHVLHRAVQIFNPDPFNPEKKGFMCMSPNCKLFKKVFAIEGEKIDIHATDKGNNSSSPWWVG